MGKLICIDPGHGGSDQGYLGYLIPEKDICLDLAYRLQKCLEQEPNLQVTLTRSYDVDMTVRERIEWANRKRADLFISLHTLSLSNQLENGFTSYVSVFADHRVRRHQCLIHNQVVLFLREYGVLDLGKRNDTETKMGQLKELRYTYMPAISLASAFISYHKETSLWEDLSFREQYTQCIADGLIQLFQQR